MDEKGKRVIQLISSDMMEDYIRLARIHSYKTGFGDGCAMTLLTEGVAIGGLIAICGVAGVGYLIAKALNKKGDAENESKQLSE